MGETLKIVTPYKKTNNTSFGFSTADFRMNAVSIIRLLRGIQNLRTLRESHHNLNAIRCWLKPKTEHSVGNTELNDVRYFCH